MIQLNDILHFQNSKIVRLRFNLNFGTTCPAIHGLNEIVNL